MVKPRTTFLGLFIFSLLAFQFNFVNETLDIARSILLPDKVQAIEIVPPSPVRNAVVTVTSQVIEEVSREEGGETIVSQMFDSPSLGAPAPIYSGNLLATTYTGEYWAEKADGTDARRIEFENNHEVLESSDHQNPRTESTPLSSGGTYGNWFNSPNYDSRFTLLSAADIDGYEFIGITGVATYTENDYGSIGDAWEDCEGDEAYLGEDGFPLTISWPRVCGSMNVYLNYREISGIKIEIMSTDSGIPYTVCNNNTSNGSTVCQQYTTRVPADKLYFRPVSANQSYTFSLVIPIVRDNGSYRYQVYNSVFGRPANPVTSNTVSREEGEVVTFYLSRSRQPASMSFTATDANGSVTRILPADANTDTQISVPPGESVTLEWSAVNTDRCTGTWVEGDNQNVALSGSIRIESVPDDAAYIFSCEQLPFDPDQVPFEVE